MGTFTSCVVPERVGFTVVGARENGDPIVMKVVTETRKVVNLHAEMMGPELGPVPIPLNPTTSDLVALRIPVKRSHWSQLS